ncbi:MAG TPA: hypothetical protein IGS52_02005 [Oscillatoriaceae cyanobacterium M33_DOE_052]|uniref:Uncharacterized protein n=1 Tax=Planktothricoides sp. SpSt-374 TaxID=2282167 RepID=A0A7C3VKN1_9CYAN|nr:hypothetical protein [Oscillatoriaceae cyanobacterium M33_DOE_052]
MSMIQIMLILHYFMPWRGGHLVAQVLLSQIYGMYEVQYALKKAGEEEEEAIERKLWRSFWLDPSNTTTNAYLGLFRNAPIFVSHQQGDKISDKSFTLVGETMPHGRVYLEVKSGMPVFLGLIKLTDETLIATWVDADETGKFQVEVTPTDPMPKTRYYVSATVMSDRLTEVTRMTLIQTDSVG